MKEFVNVEVVFRNFWLCVVVFGNKFLEFFWIVDVVSELVVYFDDGDGCVGLYFCLIYKVWKVWRVFLIV